MKTLVVYYSRTGTTKKVADALASALGADLDEIVDKKNRAGALRFIAACKDGMMKKTAEIEPPAKSPADYDMVVIGSPVWAGTITPAVRKYLSDLGGGIRKAATYVTTNRTGIESSNNAMAAMIEGEIVASEGFRMKHVKKDRHTEALEGFIEKIRG